MYNLTIVDFNSPNIHAIVLAAYLVRINIITNIITLEIKTKIISTNTSIFLYQLLIVDNEINND